MPLKSCASTQHSRYQYRKFRQCGVHWRLGVWSRSIHCTPPPVEFGKETWHRQHFRVCLRSAHAGCGLRSEKITLKRRSTALYTFTFPTERSLRDTQSSTVRSHPANVYRVRRFLYGPADSILCPHQSSRYTSPMSSALDLTLISQLIGVAAGE